MPILTNTPASADDSSNDTPVSERDWAQAAKRGFAQRCPACGTGKMFHSYLKVVDTCGSCHQALHHHRADDAPPYFTMFIVGHIVVGALLWAEKTYQPPTWVHLSIWLPLAVLMSAVLLPRIKGALIALQWAHGMHGFGETAGSKTALHDDGHTP